MPSTVCGRNYTVEHRQREVESGCTSAAKQSRPRSTGKRRRTARILQWLL